MEALAAIAVWTSIRSLHFVVLLTKMVVQVSLRLELGAALANGASVHIGTGVQFLVRVEIVEGRELAPADRALSKRKKHHVQNKNLRL